MSTCKVCGAPTELLWWICRECHSDWCSSSESGRSGWVDPAASATAFVDFITRVRAERLNGGKS